MSCLANRKAGAALDSPTYQLRFSSSTAGARAVTISPGECHPAGRAREAGRTV
jgi:hypothetical protein